MASVSVIIPVWNGAQVIHDCLSALIAQPGAGLNRPLEVICVDNASGDDSVRRIRADFPSVTLLQQPLNRGFAGGVNIGLSHASGDILVLVNQDVIVQPGWSDAMRQAFAEDSRLGIVGGTLLTAQGAIEHIGAITEKPLAYGRHLTDPADAGKLDYVTGALFAIHRRCFEATGLFDEGYHPAYYEEVDYCLRAKRKGFSVRWAAGARATHLRSSTEWRDNSTRHQINQHRMRFRHITKHFSADEVAEFRLAELSAMADNADPQSSVARYVAARDALLTLPDAIERRRTDMGAPVSSAQIVQLREAFADIKRAAYRKLSAQVNADTAINQPTPATAREIELSERIFLHNITAPQPESTLARAWRVLVKRPLSILGGREDMLQSRLLLMHTQRLDNLNKRLDLIEQLFDND